jgi:hypothetical protein
VACAAWITTASSATCQDSVKPATSINEVCRNAKNEQDRLRCYEKGNPGASTSQRQPIEPGTWQLDRRPNPAGGPDSISITKIADPDRSDYDIAGLMLRCGEGATTEVLVVLTDPLPPRTHPKVIVVTGATTTEFTGSVLTPGALVLLPEKASALVEHAWLSAPELAVAIAGTHRSLHGVVPLGDIGTAMQTLESNCQK